jgi:hypothetical protein
MYAGKDKLYWNVNGESQSSEESNQPPVQDCQPLSQKPIDDHVKDQDAAKERMAIMEYEGGLSREEAENRVLGKIKGASEGNE